MYRANLIIVALGLSIGGLCLFGCKGKSDLAPAAVGGQPDRVPVSELPDWSLAKPDAASLAEGVHGFELKIVWRRCRRALIQLYMALPDNENSPLLILVWGARTNARSADAAEWSTDLSGDEAKASLDDTLREVMGSIKNRRQTWSETPAEHGTINGLPFVRSTWSGVVGNEARKGLAGREMHGNRLRDNPR